MQKPLSYIELSESNLRHNIRTLRSVASEKTKFAFAVKGNAYGHGLAEIVTLAESSVDYFIVNSIEELRTLRSVSKKPTFILGYILPSFIEEAIKLGCIMSIFSQEQFKKVEKIAKKINTIQEVHIACDAHLGREGFLETELADFLAYAKKSANVKITGIYSHFANIEDTNNFTHAEKQINTFKRINNIAEISGFSNLDTHISATSGLLVYEKKLDHNIIVRIGIGMYGLWPSEYLRLLNKKNKLELKPVLSWKTHIAQVKILPALHTIGYGLTYMTTKKTKIAVIPQGYADGYSRNLSNKGEVIISGKKCKVLGRVSMNMFVVDVSKISKVKDGDEVVIIGQMSNKNIPAEYLGELSGTINYEITTRISALLPRIVVK